MRRWAFIFAACALAAGACKRTNKERPPAAEPPIALETSALYPTITPREVEAITIERAGADTVSLRRGDDQGWRVTAPIDDVADERAISFALEELRKIEWGADPVAVDRAGWAAHAANPDQVVTLRVRQGGADLPALHLSKRKVARVGQAVQLYKIHHISYFTFVRELRFWRDRTLLRLPADDVTGMRVDDRLLTRVPAPPPADGQKARDPDRWTATDGAAVDQDAANSLFRRLVDLEGDTIADDGASFGTVRRRLALRVGDREHAVEIGGDTSDGRAYARRAGSERLLLLSASDRNLLSRPLAP